MRSLVLTRPGLFAFAALFLVLGAGFVLRLDAVTWLWPWPESGFAHIFIGAVLAAIGATMTYMAWGSYFASAAGGSWALIVMFGGMAVSLAIFARSGGPSFGHHIVSFLLVAAPSVLAVIEAGRHEPDPRPVPRWLRRLLWAFAAVLAAIALGLFLKIVNAFPVRLDVRSMELFGWVFLGFAVNFVHVAWRGRMRDASALLAGSLAYDLVLIGPFLWLIGSVAPGHGIALLVHTAMAVATGAVALRVLLRPA